MPWMIAMKLFGLGKTLLSWGRSALRWIVSDWRHILIALVSLLAAYQWLEAGKYERAHGKAVTSLERANKTIADMTAASEQSRVAQIAMNQSVTDKQIQIERLNRETSKLQATAIRDASVRYAVNNRLSKVCPSFASATDPATKDSAAKGDDGLQASAVLLSAADFELLNARTADAIRYEDWARSLVGAGLAVEGD